jgi:outer membrane protein assembly factor BamB
MDHHLHALDIETGSSVWESEALGGSIAGTPALSSDGVLFVGTIAEEMLAIDADDGRVLWRVPAGGWIWSGPLLAGDRLYYGDMDGSVYAVDAKNGSVIWRIQPDTGENRAITGTPLVIGDALYFGAASGILYAVNLSDGSPRWNKAFEGKLHFGPIGAGERILVAPTAGDQLLVALDQNGNQVWAFSQQK